MFPLKDVFLNCCFHKWGQNINKIKRYRKRSIFGWQWGGSKFKADRLRWKTSMYILLDKRTMNGVDSGWFHLSSYSCQIKRPYDCYLKVCGNSTSLSVTFSHQLLLMSCLCATFQEFSRYFKHFPDYSICYGGLW